MTNQLKLIIGGAILVIGLILFAIINPFGYNDGGNRTVVQRMDGTQFVRFEAGTFYSGFFAKETEWPNQISVVFSQDKPNYDLVDNAIEVGEMDVMFSDRFTAGMKGISQYVLPISEKEMLEIHNTHRTPESLVQKRLAPYTKECIQSAAQLMTADMHSSGGRAQMSQDFNDQLRNGVFLLITKEKVVFDSIDNEKKRIFENIIQTDVNGQQKRKASSIKEYGITVADAQITDYKYDSKFNERRNKLIDASTKTAASKSDLLVAQQQALTAKAEGEKKLVEIDYVQWGGTPKSFEEVKAFCPEIIDGGAVWYPDAKAPEGFPVTDSWPLFIKTLEGVMTASMGDYILKGVNGEYYPCKPDIFNKTYDKL
jgi:hypothetical protein